MSEHELWNELGNLYFLSGAYNQAAHAYERSIQTRTTFGRPYSNLALTYVQQGKYDEAIDLYRRSIELLADDKERAISWNRLGSVYRHLKDYSKAVIAFQEADELDPHSADDFPPDNPARHQAPPEPSSVLNEPVVAAVEEPGTDLGEALVAQTVEEPTAELIEETVEVVAEEPISEAIQTVDEVAAEQGIELAEEPIAELAEASVEAVAEAPISEAVPVVVEPVEEPTSEVVQTTTEAVVDDVVVAVADDIVVASQEPEIEPELEWWDVDERRVQAATQSPDTIEEAAEDFTTSWTPADLSQFQQDLSEMPQAGSLTTWGDPDFEDDFELWSPLDPRPEIEDPDFDSDNISTWLPLPEEEALSLDELRVPPFVDELEAEASEPPTEWNEPDSYQVISSEEFAATMSFSPADSLDLIERSEIAPDTEKSWKPQEVDIDVEERPAADLIAITPELSSAVQTETVACAAQPELVQATLAETPAEPEPEVAERDEEEQHEIDMGIAKFRRVVQINPRNAHAWDALGTLYKSARLYRDAILAYQQAISNDPSKSLYYHHLGLVYACEGRDEDAIGAFQRVIEIDPEYSLAHATLGGYYRKMGLEELAQKHIGKAMKNIFDSENEYNRACLEAICGNADQAIELLHVALKNKQTYVDWILRDPDLDFIRQDPRFKQLISEYTR